MRVQDHAQDAVDAEPGMPEASVGVVHFAFGPRGSRVSGTVTIVATTSWCSPEKKREPQAASDTKILPMDLRVCDRLADETGEWEVIGRPYTTAGGKTARVRVQRVGQPNTAALKSWGAHERVSVKRTSAQEGKR